MFHGLPRGLIAFAIVATVAIELVAKLPDILLIPQRLHGQAGEHVFFRPS
jgi:hypothetical protein